MSSAIENAIDANKDVNVIAVANGVDIEGVKGCAARVYALDGTMIDTMTLAEDFEHITLAQGMYIIVINNVSYKVVIM